MVQVTRNIFTAYDKRQVAIGVTWRCESKTLTVVAFVDLLNTSCQGKRGSFSPLFMYFNNESRQASVS